MAETTKSPAEPRAPRKATAAGEHLSLRFVRADFTSFQGFQWPREVGAVVTAPDWRDNRDCGNGLHGWLWGEGDVRSWGRQRHDVMIVVRHGAYVELDGKVKFPSCTVAFVGDTASAPKWLAENGGAGRKIIHGTATAGDFGTATAASYGAATAGYRGTATAGDFGTATAASYGAATAGYRGTATAGDFGTATAASYGAATAGYRGTATAASYGTATAGDFGTATAGYYGTATAGYYGTATAGDFGTATAGDYGIFVIRWHDGKRYRLAEGIVGENGILPNVAYRVVDGKLAQVPA